jgi:PAS domain S-box-containing protein
MRESEQSHRLLVESVRQYAIIQTDDRGIVTTWNPGAERLFGYTSAEMMGQPSARILTANDQNEKISEIEIQRVMQGERWEDERWLVRKDGSQFWAHWVAEPVRDESGRLRGVTKVLRDDTEKRGVEQTIRASLAEKEALLRDVHHRINNNLQLITSLISLQSNEIRDKHVLALLDQTRNRVFLVAAVHEIIYRSQEYRGLDMAAYLDRLVPELVRLHDNDRRVQFRIDGGSGQIELQHAVPLGLLLNELVANACAHAFPAGRSGELSVTAGRKDGFNVLTVADNGIGFLPGLDYHQPSSLGLRLVHMLAQQLGGEVNVVSNAGVCIHVRFPSQQS